MLKRTGLLLLLFLMCLVNVYAVNTPKPAQALWVDSVYEAMTTAQKIGQLIVTKNESLESLELLLREKVPTGGLFVPRGNANEVLGLVNAIKEKQAVPFLTMHSQYGNFDTTFPGSIPYLSTFSKSSIADKDLLKRLEEKEIEVHKELGINTVMENNFRVDIVDGELLIRDKNTMLKTRQLVDLKNGLLQDASLLNAINLDLSFFNYNFVKYIPEDLFESGKWEMIKSDYSIIFINSLNFENGWSGDKFEKEIVKGLFRKKFEYEGILAIDADAIINQVFGQTEYQSIEVELINAGFDVVATSNPVEAYQNLMAAYEDHDIKDKDLEEKVKNILTKKFILLHENESPFSGDYYALLNAPGINNDVYEAYAASITLLKNESDAVPFRNLGMTNFASLMIGEEELTTFQKTLEKYAPFTHFVLPAYDINDEAFASLLNKLTAFDNVVVGIHAPFNKKVIGLLSQLKDNTNLVITVFDDGLPEHISEVSDVLLLSYEDNEYTQELAPQIIFGARPAIGIYPGNADEIASGGIVTEPLGRLAFSKSYKCGFDEASLSAIDAIATEAVKLGATPGCQVLVARHGNIIYDKSFGYYTYDSLLEVSGKTIYDVASITKVAATTQAIMFLVEHGVLDLDEKLETYLPELAETNKGNLVVSDVLMHQSGLKAFLPLWSQTLNTEVEIDFYSNYPHGEYLSEVALGMYSSLALKDSIYSWTVKSDLRRKPWNKRNEPYDYKYSDLGFYLMYVLAERLLNQPMDEFLDQNLYDPLGMSSTSFNPLCKFHILNMAPTEDDKFFRHTLVWGNVHDQIAAMNGGVSGHAGLFSNTVDLAKLGQMHLQGGLYGGQRFFNVSSIDLFTSCHSETNRRGLGWDKPALDDGFNPASEHASPATYGHRGFTGTAIWVDPEYDLVYVFLSNRIYPDMTNNKLNNFDIRRRIHDAIYDSIHNFEQHLN